MLWNTKRVCAVYIYSTAEVGQWVKFTQTWGLEQFPTHYKIQTVACAYSPSNPGKRQADPKGLLAEQSGQIIEF